MRMNGHFSRHFGRCSDKKHSGCVAGPVVLFWFVQAMVFLSSISLLWLRSQSVRLKNRTRLLFTTQTTSATSRRRFQNIASHWEVIGVGTSVKEVKPCIHRRASGQHVLFYSQWTNDYWQSAYMLDMPPEIEDAGVNASPSVSTSAKKPQGILRVSKHGGKPKQQTPVAQSTITGKMNEKLKRKMSQKKMDITDGTSDMSSDEDRSRSSSDHSRNSAQSAYWGSSSHSSEEAHRALHDSSDENSSQSSENSFAVEELSDLLEIPSTKLKSDNNTRQEPTPTGENPVEADEAPPDTVFRLSWSFLLIRTLKQAC